MGHYICITANSIAAAAMLTGCVAIPDLPEDYSLPIKEIVSHSICELRTSFLALKDSKAFDAPHWLISITLTPKVDGDATLSAGLTGKSTIASAAKYVSSWAIGSPGMQVYAKGHRDGSITYNIRSKILLTKDFPIACDRESASYHTLAQNLGIQKWFERTVYLEDGVMQVARIDKPAFNSQITIKFSGNGSYTYTFPYGTDLASLGGSYNVDELLSIAMVQAPDKESVEVVTLPSEGVFRPKKPVTVTTQAPLDAQYRLDQLQTEQILKNLQIKVQ